MEEEQVYTVPVVPNAQPLLTGHEGKIVAKFKQEVLQPPDQRLLQFILRVLVFQPPGTRARMGRGYVRRVSGHLPDVSLRRGCAARLSSARKTVRRSDDPTGERTTRIGELAVRRS